LTPTRHFQCRTFGRSVTSPEILNYLLYWYLRRVHAGKSLAKTDIGKKLGKTGSVSVVYRKLSYGILARFGMIRNLPPTGESGHSNPASSHMAPPFILEIG
jgi:hypothetical protein